MTGSNLQPAEEAPRPGSRLAYVAVVNTDAGRGKAFDPALLTEAGLPGGIEILAGCGKDMDTLMAQAFQAQPAAVIVVGGDGTARAAALRAVATGVPIVPLPGGTMNVLPKLVFGHADMARAIAELPNLSPRRLPVGKVGESMFFLSAAFGFAGPLTRLREATRSNEKRWTRVWGAVVACFRSIGPSLQSRLRWRPGKGQWRRAHTLVVALGEIDRILAPDTEDHGRGLEAASLDVRTFWRMAGFGAALMAGRWREHPNVEIVHARVIEIDTPTRRPLAVLDGEPVRLSLASQVTVVPDGLPVLGPPLADPGSDKA